MHFLVIPKKHIPSAAALTEEDGAPCWATSSPPSPGCATGLGCDGGYRIVSNVGEDAGQSVKHLHFHVMAKRQ